jgi:predicted nucleic acid-binding protein
MIVVADISPLNYLILLGHANILNEIYGRVLVPPAVLVEMLHSEAPPEVRSWASAPPAWLEQRQARQLDPSLAARLGAGEREAISLPIEIKPDVLLIDDRAGRKEAESRRLEVAGTLAVLLQASLRGHFDFSDILKQLYSLEFRSSPSMEREMLVRYERARKGRSGKSRPVD